MAAKCTRLDWWLRVFNRNGFSPIVKMTTIRVQIERNSVRTDSSTETMVLEICQFYAEDRVDDMLVAGSDMAEFNKLKCWAKLVRILISEGSLSLLKILGTKSLAAMFTRVKTAQLY
ncbi:hypothetical protein Tco_0943479 [Tanacetum coccineum]